VKAEQNNIVLRLQLILSYLLYLPLLPLLPLIIHQGKTVRRTTLRLPEAGGKRECITQPTAPALLHIGESTVAGVGVSDFRDGLTASLFRELNTHGSGLINWQAIAMNGATAVQLCRLLQNKPPLMAGITVITLGVNDTTAFTPLKRWGSDLEQLAQRLPPATRVLFTQVPDMRQFPALPVPLNLLLGLRARQLDLALQCLCHQHGWHHLPADMKVPAQMMAPDGYHPNAAGYRYWAEHLAATISHLFRYPG